MTMRYEIWGLAFEMVLGGLVLFPIGVVDVLFHRAGYDGRDVDSIWAIVKYSVHPFYHMETQQVNLNRLSGYLGNDFSLPISFVQ